MGCRFTKCKFFSCIFFLAWTYIISIVVWHIKARYNADRCILDFNSLTSRTSITFDGEPPSYEEIARNYPNLTLGGHYPGPPTCHPDQTLAIIVPFRDRDTHLRFWLQHMIGNFIEQKLSFTIFVAEQEGNGTFNKGQLMNTAYKWAIKQNMFDCFVFHDVDMIAEETQNIYHCKENAAYNLSPLIDKFNYSENSIYSNHLTVGGATAFKAWQFDRVDGYSNEYWGWGGEDDDLAMKLRLRRIPLRRAPFNIARFKMIRHERDKGNPVNENRWNLLQIKNIRRRLFLKSDGLSNLNTHITKIFFLPTHTHITVKVSDFVPVVNKPPPTTTKKPQNTTVAVVATTTSVKSKQKTSVTSSAKPST